MCRVISLANQKGGVGKTISCLNLGWSLANMGKRVLLIDLDPQSSLTQACGVNAENNSLADVLGDSRPGRLTMPAIIRHIAPGLDLAPADLSLTNTELGLPARPRREDVLKRVLDTVNYDLVLIDCPPSLGVLTIAALVASTAVIAPVTPDALGLRGLAMFTTTLEAVRPELNPALQLLGVIVTQYDKRQTLHQAAIDDILGAGISILGITPRRAEAARTAGNGQPSTDLADDYRQIAEKITAWQAEQN